MIFVALLFPLAVLIAVFDYAPVVGVNPALEHVYRQYQDAQARGAPTEEEQEAHTLALRALAARRDPTGFPRDLDMIRDLAWDPAFLAQAEAAQTWITELRAAEPQAMLREAETYLARGETSYWEGSTPIEKVRSYLVMDLGFQLARITADQGLEDALELIERARFTNPRYTFPDAFPQSEFEVEQTYLCCPIGTRLSGNGFRYEEAIYRLRGFVVYVRPDEVQNHRDYFLEINSSPGLVASLDGAWRWWTELQRKGDEEILRIAQELDRRESHYARLLANELYSEAERLGNINAKFHLYSGFLKDAGADARLFVKKVLVELAAGGLEKAQLLLAEEYQRGIGFDRDVSKASYWAIRAGAPIPPSLEVLRTGEDRSQVREWLLSGSHPEP